MASGLFELLGRDPSDPGVIAARRDAADHAKLIELLVRHREEAGLTQTQVATAMNTTQSTVSNFERIGGDPKLSTIFRYARAVGLRIRFFGTLDGDGTRVLVPRTTSANLPVLRSQTIRPRMPAAGVR